mmetsp:Transcript_14595/g.38618  ORF Transcript_14595/g.38618 Transcript_14595/m.38618 type:complete len:94 (+) Transcript_14595:3-284(+)
MTQGTKPAAPSALAGGRGRGATMPAWMTAQGITAAPAPAPAQVSAEVTAATDALFASLGGEFAASVTAPAGDDEVSRAQDAARRIMAAQFGQP